MKEKILIADDDDSLRWVLKKAFEKKGYRVFAVPKGKDCIRALETREYGLALVDIMMPDMNGLDIMETAKKKGIDTEFVIMTAQNTMKNAIEAMKRGSYDYITKPFDIDEVEIIARKALKSRRLAKEVTNLRGELRERYEVGTNIIGKSPLMQKIYKTIGKISGSDVTILIQGESGTGKELIAKAIHYNSDRSGMPFVAVNSAAIPVELLESELFGHEKGAFSGAVNKKPGKFELADSGTLFLDEIGDMSVDLQMKLLRAIQEKEIDRVGGTSPIKVDVRIIAATNRDLLSAIKEGKFREDLYYRLNVISLKLPPLRKRAEDISLLVDFFLERFAEKMNSEKKIISDKARKSLVNYSWPGNVRELENVIRRTVVLSASSTIFPEDLPSKIRDGSESSVERCDDMSLEEILKVKLNPLVSAIDENNTEGLYSMVLTEMERPLLRLVLEKCGWNQVKAAKVLGLNRNTLKKKMDILELKKSPKGR